MRTQDAELVGLNGALLHEPDDTPLAEFFRSRRRGGSRDETLSNRLAGGLAVVLLYLSIAVLLDQKELWLSSVSVTLPLIETTVRLIPDEKRRLRVPPPPKHFISHLIRPHAVKAAPPQFSVLPETKAAPEAPLPVTAATTSPLSGGARPDGTAPPVPM